ncbi:MAG: hypothetical protein SXG53_03670 [Pseudomonadota bacterium]|nr:hypothetical protein [Pseudomonadota bacterium]
MNAARHSNPLADDTADDLSGEQPRSRRLRFELIFGSLWLAFGLFLLPALIFWVGNALLGAYGENAGLSRFYVDFYADLADASVRAWSIALGPVVLIYLLRAVFIGVKAEPAAREEVEDDVPSPPRRAPVAKEPPPKRTPPRPARVEPRVSRD